MNNVVSNTLQRYNLFLIVARKPPLRAVPFFVEPILDSIGDTDMVFSIGVSIIFVGYKDTYYYL